MSKNITSGGYTAQEARNLLLIRGIEHVKGIVPHKAQKIENLGEFDDLPIVYVESVYCEIANYEYWLWSVDGYGEIVGVALDIDCNICHECKRALQAYYDAVSPTLYFRGRVNRGYCGVCGAWEGDDGIPF